MGTRAAKEWRSGEAAIWLLLGPALGGVFGASSLLHVLSARSDVAEVLGAMVLAALVGLICGLVMAPVMAAGAWRREWRTAALIQLVIGALAAGVSFPLGRVFGWSGPMDIYGSILITAGAVVLAAVMCRFCLPRRLDFTVPGRCPRCGYDARGLPESVCPECGNSVGAGGGVRRA